MKIHEYQARDLLSSFGIPVPAGSVIKDANDAANAYTEVTQAAGTDLAVVKAQVFAGGRGKAGFVKLVRSAADATAAADFMLSNKMVSVQTGPEGLDVNTLLVAAGVDIADRAPDTPDEYYIAITTDRNTRRNTLIASREGGVEIEQVAADRIIDDVRALAAAGGLEGSGQLFFCVLVERAGGIDHRFIGAEVASEGGFFF